MLRGLAVQATTSRSQVRSKPGPLHDSFRRLALTRRRLTLPAYPTRVGGVPTCAADSMRCQRIPSRIAVSHAGLGGLTLQRPQKLKMPLVTDSPRLHLGIDGWPGFAPGPHHVRIVARLELEGGIKSVGNGHHDRARNA